MKNCLIGYTGFVGSNLLRQFEFEKLFRSINIDNIKGKHFNLVVCAGAPGEKWIANLNPDDDKRRIEFLIRSLKTIKCRTFVLISTADVFKLPQGVDEASEIDELGLHPYGLNRRALEKFVQKNFPSHLIVRLPGLVGPGLRKNVIFDFLNNNNLNLIDCRAVYQFYPIENLWRDISIALKEKLKLVHLTSEPISVSKIALHGFRQSFSHKLNNIPACYDMRTRHGKLFGSKGYYQYGCQATIETIKAYIESEPLTIFPVSKKL
jgi:hypothetical protein